MKLEIDLQDLTEMLLGHMRWAMTKQTFAPYISSEILKRYSRHLSISQKEDLVKCLKQEFEKVKSEKYSSAQLWEDLILKLENQVQQEPSN
jgi:hypothetical protein